MPKLSVKEGRLYIFLDDCNRFFYIRKHELEKMLCSGLSVFTKPSVMPFLEF